MIDPGWKWKKINKKEREHKLQLHSRLNSKASGTLIWWVFKCPFKILPFIKREADSYLALFEMLETKCGLPEDKWLVCLSRSFYCGALLIYAGSEDLDARYYKILKQALLRWFKCISITFKNVRKVKPTLIFLFDLTHMWVAILI